MGLLTVMDKEQFTFDEIVEELANQQEAPQVTPLKILEMSEGIEYITLPVTAKGTSR